MDVVNADFDRHGWDFAPNWIKISVTRATKPQRVGITGSRTAPSVAASVKLISAVTEVLSDVGRKEPAGKRQIGVFSLK
jgi:hypothetical protein